MNNELTLFVVISAIVVVVGVPVVLFVWAEIAPVKIKDKGEEIELISIDIDNLTRNDLKSIPTVWINKLNKLYLSPTFAADIKIFLRELLSQIREAKLNINILQYWPGNRHSLTLTADVDAFIQKCKELGFIHTKLITFPAEVDSYGLIIKPKLKFYIIEVTQKGIDYLEE